MDVNDLMLSSNIIYNMLYILVMAFVIFKCCEKFDNKFTWGVITIILTIISIFVNGSFVLSTFFKDLTISALVSIVLTYVFKKIYELTRSFIGFIVVSVIVFFVLQYIW